MTVKDEWFRYRAAAVIIEDGCVLMATNAKEDYFYSVGGAVQIGESAEDAAIREAYEETGVRFEIDRLVFIHENFFRGHGTLAEYRVCHEVALYFLMKNRGTKALDPHGTVNGVPETLHWLPIDKLNEYRAFPLFFRDELQPLPTGIKHIVTRE